MSEIYNDFLSYRDKYGLNQMEVGKTSQNGTLATVEYLLCLQQNKAPEFWSEVERVREVFKSLEVAPGLSTRYPGSTEFDSMDNSSALLVFSYLWDFRRYARDMKNHGLNVRAKTFDTTQDIERNMKYWPIAVLRHLGHPRYFWNNQNSDKFCFTGWYGRSPGFLGLLDITSLTGKTAFKTLSLAVGQYLSLLEPLGDTSGRKLSYVVWEALKGRSRLWEALYNVWNYILHKQYKNGITDVYDIYYGYKDKNHPIIKWSKK